MTLRNAKIDMFRGSMRLAVNQWGKIEAAEGVSFEPKVGGSGCWAVCRRASSGRAGRQRGAGQRAGGQRALHLGRQGCWLAGLGYVCRQPQAVQYCPPRAARHGAYLVQISHPHVPRHSVLLAPSLCRPTTTCPLWSMSSSKCRLRPRARERHRLPVMRPQLHRAPPAAPEAAAAWPFLSRAPAAQPPPLCRPDQRARSANLTSRMPPGRRSDWYRFSCAGHVFGVGLALSGFSAWLRLTCPNVECSDMCVLCVPLPRLASRA